MNEQAIYIAARGRMQHNAYTVCEVDLARHTVRLYWKRSDGTPYA
jgi:uncharacterized protein YigE (DUF2233 family)